MSGPSYATPGRTPASPALRGLLVIGAGVLTTGLSLAGFGWLAANVDDFNVMGWYLLWIVPVGPMIVGFAAGSGYGLASWLSGRKISGPVLATVLLLQTGAYAGAQWLEYETFTEQVGGVRVGFWTYYDAATRAIAFENRRGESSTGELGLLGYGVRLLEVLGFALGGLAAPAILRSKNYCEPCESYMRTRRIAVLPAAVPERKLGRRDAEGRQAYEAEMNAALQQGLDAAGTVLRAAHAGDAGAIRQVLDPHAAQPKQNDKLLHRVHVSLSRCRHCNSGVLACALVSGQGQNIKQQPLASIPLASSAASALG